MNKIILKALLVSGFTFSVLLNAYAEDIHINKHSKAETNISDNKTTNTDPTKDLTKFYPYLRHVLSQYKFENPDEIKIIKGSLSLNDDGSFKTFTVKSQENISNKEIESAKQLLINSAPYPKDILKNILSTTSVTFASPAYWKKYYLLREKYINQIKASVKEKWSPLRKGDVGDKISTQFLVCSDGQLLRIYPPKNEIESTKKQRERLEKAVRRAAPFPIAPAFLDTGHAMIYLDYIYKEKRLIVPLNERKSRFSRVNHNWGPYISRQRVKIRELWQPAPSQKDLKITVFLSIDKSGKLLQSKIINTDNLPEEQLEVALKALKNANPFEPLPHFTDLKRIDVKFVLEYYADKNKKWVSDAVQKNTKQTNDYNKSWDDYIKNIQLKIKSAWKPSSSESSKRIITVFTIDRKGNLTNIKILKGEKKPTQKSMEAAIKAIRDSAPFKPLPEQYEGKDVEVQFIFDYDVYRNNKKL